MGIKKWTILLILPAILAMAGCNSDNENGEAKLPAGVVFNPNSADGKASAEVLPIITFEKMEHDFGRILEGETVSYEFTFTNTGKADLIVADVTTSCGCAVPSYSKIPIRSGNKGTIKVSFNSQGRRGLQTKSIVVVANPQPNTEVLRIKAHVVNAAAEN